MNRRKFLIGCSAGAAMIGMSHWNLMATPLLSTPTIPNLNNQHTFILLFLRGGCDGLQLLAPFTDHYYHDARPNNLRLNEKQGFLVKDNTSNIPFRFHPKAKELYELYQEQELAIIHSSGLSNATRSHFDAQDLIERGLIKDNNIRSGWMGRYLEHYKQQGKIPGLAASNHMAQAFHGYHQATSMAHLSEFNLLEQLRANDLIASLYQNDPIMGNAAQQTLNTINFLNANLSEAQYEALDRPVKGYPDDWICHELNRSLQTVAHLIKMNAGVQMVNVDYGGWDTHENQHDVFPRLVSGLSRSLSAFYRDIKEHRDNVTILVMSEFGRRLRANRSHGTDHGHGNVMFALGGKVNGGNMYGIWPGLHPDQLDKGVDLAVTTDYRNVIGNILKKTMNTEDINKVFPGFTSFYNMDFI